jgi:hypothetical protein
MHIGNNTVTLQFDDDVVSKKLRRLALHPTMNNRAKLPDDCYHQFPSLEEELEAAAEQQSADAETGGIPLGGMGMGSLLNLGGGSTESRKKTSTAYSRYFMEKYRRAEVGPPIAVETLEAEWKYLLEEYKSAALQLGFDPLKGRFVTRGDDEESLTQGNGGVPLPEGQRLRLWADLTETQRSQVQVLNYDEVGWNLMAMTGKAEDEVERTIRLSRGKVNESWEAVKEPEEVPYNTKDQVHPAHRLVNGELAKCLLFRKLAHMLSTQPTYDQADPGRAPPWYESRATAEGFKVHYSVCAL